MIRDNDPVTNRYISVPRDYAPLNCASYIGGIVRGVLDAADFVRHCAVSWALTHRVGPAGERACVSVTECVSVRLSRCA